VKKTERTTPEPDDADLTRLFAAQTDAPPATLDALILAAARDAVSDRARDPVSSTAANDPSQRAARGPRPAIMGWFAVAATVVLGLSLAPRLLQSPGSALGEQAPAQIQGSPPAQAFEPSSAQVFSPSPSPQQAQNSQFAQRSALTGVQVSRPESAVPGESREAIIQDAQARNYLRKSEAGSQAGISNTYITDEAQVPEDYRKSPETWMKQIRTLVKDGHQAKAEEELDAFRQVHPDHEPGFRVRGQ
jgi:hypothetical protein